MARTYRVRNDYVIVRVRQTNRAGVIAVGDRAEEGKVYTIHAFGPEITDLKVGDQVTLFADNDAAFFNIPGEKELVIIKSRYVSSVIEMGVDE